MKTPFEKLLTWAKERWFALTVIALLTVLLLIGKCNNNELADKYQIQSVELSTLNDSVKTVVSKNGDLTFKLSSVSVESDNRKEALDAAGFEIKELRAKDIKWRDINFALKAQLQAQGSGQTVLHDTLLISKTDTIKQANFNWNNKFLFLSGNIREKELKFDYTYKTSIDLISEKKGKSYIISAYLGDKNASITTANSITIVPKNKWWNRWYVHAGAGLVTGYFIFK